MPKRSWAILSRAPRPALGLWRRRCRRFALFAALLAAAALLTTARYSFQTIVIILFGLLIEKPYEIVFFFWHVQAPTWLFNSFMTNPIFEVIDENNLLMSNPNVIFGGQII